MRRRHGTGEAAGGAAGGAAPAGPRGTDVILVDLRTGRHQLLGSIGDIAFNKKGDLLAYTVDAAVKDGNGLFVFDTRNGRITTLDNDAKNYGRLAWNDDGTAIAALKGLDPEPVRMRERNNVLVAFADVPNCLDGGETPVKGVTFDPAKDASFPKGWVVSDRAALTWSDDNKRVFFGMKEQVPAADTAQRRSTDEQADVDVWGTSDERTHSVQLIRAESMKAFEDQDR